MSRSNFLSAKHFKIKMSNIPNNKGSVGRNMLNPNPCTNSESGSESGVKNTTRYRSLSKAKTASKTMVNAIGKALIIIECFFTKKNVFSKINSAEIK
ncbi:hypothetical protein AQPE_2494 [Aquipluma nitroreducens]|uniref:Uncharacterized protein n=1 Tax=Aquipluma nitroreducens TaxID=2010828 RepID=A0A5K7S9T7_9BACT|nr:hypothetical protein AQPE_2494 [Aquipluma nitroreducens]